jgi:NADPH:quinone reductase-like Zn-dependent oxidoreductase
MVAVTGMRAVKTVGGVKAGDRVLVHAASSGTGSFNIQLAKALGAQVATTVDSPDKVQFAQALGADLVIDVTHQDFTEAAREWTDGAGVDVVIDNLGGGVLAQSLAAARVGGTVVTMGFVAGVNSVLHVRDFFFSHKRLLGTLMGDVQDLKAGLELVGAGRIKPQLGLSMPMSEAAEAHRLLSGNKINGNIVMRPWE